MKSFLLFLFSMLLFLGSAQAQNKAFEKLNFIFGNWEGTGSGFGSQQSTIESSFQLVMNGTYIEVSNESQFEPTADNPQGDHHIDKGYISYDKSRQALVFRQFNNEGYINQYVLNGSASNDSVLVFETEYIENFIPGGKARWTIRKISNTAIETTFDLSFPDKPYACFGTNKLQKK